MNVTFLGTGTSHGVPSIDCMINNYAQCSRGVCRLSEADPRHRRTRSSILVEYNGASVLFDISADFREQTLREKVRRIDAVVITHGHADHICGVPDIRSFTKDQSSALPVYGSAESCGIISQSFGYIFDPHTFVGGGIPRIGLREINGPFELFGETVIPVRVSHGSLGGCFGYRLGPLAYIPDMKSIDTGQEEILRGTRILILNCLRIEREHSTHMILAQSMALARRIAPQRCYFIHMCHDIHYELDSPALDPWMEFSYDGLRLEVS